MIIQFTVIPLRGTWKMKNHFQDISFFKWRQFLYFNNKIFVTLNDIKQFSRLSDKIYWLEDTP
jgi:hypothetical protein